MEKKNSLAKEIERIIKTKKKIAEKLEAKECFSAIKKQMSLVSKLKNLLYFYNKTSHHLQGNYGSLLLRKYHQKIADEFPLDKLLFEQIVDILRSKKKKKVVSVFPGQCFLEKLLENSGFEISFVVDRVQRRKKGEKSCDAKALDLPVLKTGELAAEISEEVLQFFQQKRDNSIENLDKNKALNTPFMDHLHAFHTDKNKERRGEDVIFYINTSLETRDSQRIIDEHDCLLTVEKKNASKIFFNTQTQVIQLRKFSFLDTQQTMLFIFH